MTRLLNSLPFSNSCSYFDINVIFYVSVFYYMYMHVHHLMHAARECHNIYKKINYTYGGKLHSRANKQIITQLSWDCTRWWLTVVACWLFGSHSVEFLIKWKKSFAIKTSKHLFFFVFLVSFFELKFDFLILRRMRIFLEFNFSQVFCWLLWLYIFQRPNFKLKKCITKIHLKTQ